MPGVARVLEKTLSHLANTLEQAEQTHRTSSGTGMVLVLDPRAKLIAALLLTIVLVSCRRLDILTALFVFLTAASLICRISWKRLLASWGGGLFFAAAVALPAIFTSGWKIALLLVLRSEASLTCWLLLIMTTPFNQVLRALRALYVPAVFIAILSMTFRYIFLLVETAQDMLFSRRSRIVGRMNASDSRRLLVSTSGVLLGKSVQMSDDVYQAMTSRGFRGDVHILEDFKMTARDWGFMFSAITFVSTVWMVGG